MIIVNFVFLLGFLFGVDAHNKKTKRIEGDVFVKLEPKCTVKPIEKLWYEGVYRTNSFYSKARLSAPYCKAVNDKIDCKYNQRYHTVDGSCNNLNYKWWGATKTPYQRLLKPNYLYADDYKSLPSSFSENKHPLPDPRQVATRIQHNDVTNGLNSWFTVFGQLVAHDLADTPKSHENCPCGVVSEECFNIPISTYVEKFLRAFEATPIEAKCLPFPRSRSASKVFDCDYKRREQYTIGTHWVDLDIIYGRTTEEQDYLRVFRGGLLKTDKVPGSDGESLPILDINQCNQPDTNTKGCVFSGDKRVSDFTFLTVAHTLLHRMHNYFARKLSMVNQKWSDDTIYYEARRINIAIYQNIVYSEYLPLAVGKNTMKEFGLNTLESGYSYDYNPKLFPNNYNEFITAGFRLHHTVHAHFEKKDQDLNKIEDFFLDKMMANQFEYYNNLDELLRGFFGGETYVSGFQIAIQLNHNLNLFTKGNEKSSMGAINIQRGRDHGLPSYCAVRVLAGLPKPEDWDDLKNFSEDALEMLQENYRHPCDIDMWIGLMSEKPTEDFLLSETQRFLVGTNFYNLKHGDRHYFENGQDNKNRITLAQLDQIRKFQFTDLLCAVLGTPEIPKFGFFEINSGEDTEEVKRGKPGEQEEEADIEEADIEDKIEGDNEQAVNHLIACADLKEFDFEFWKDI